jgi:sulfur carrier protein
VSGRVLELTVNGDPLSVPEGTTIAEVVARLIDGAEPKGIAVAVDRCVIPRSEWSTTAAVPGATIEIVTAAAGG